MSDLLAVPRPVAAQAVEYSCVRRPCRCGVVLLRARLGLGCAGAVLCALRCAGAVRVGFVVSCAALGKLAANFPTPGESRSVCANWAVRGQSYSVYVCICVYV